MGNFPNAVRSLPEYSLLVQGHYRRSLWWQGFVSSGAGDGGLCKIVPLSGCRADFLGGNSSLSSASWNHLQTPAVNGSFTFSHKKQMHLDTRFLTAFSGIHHNRFFLGKKYIQLAPCYATLSNTLSCRNLYLPPVLHLHFLLCNQRESLPL